MTHRIKQEAHAYANMRMMPYSNPYNQPINQQINQQPIYPNYPGQPYMAYPSQPMNQSNNQYGQAPFPSQMTQSFNPINNQQVNPTIGQIINHTQTSPFPTNQGISLQQNQLNNQPSTQTSNQTNIPHPPVVPSFDHPIHPFNQSMPQPMPPPNQFSMAMPHPSFMQQAKQPIQYNPSINHSILGGPLPITIVRLTRKHIKMEGGALHGTMNHMIQSRVKSSEVNYMQRIQGTMVVPHSVIRGEGRLMMSISTRDSNDTNSVATVLRPSKQLMYDVRPYFDWTMNEVSGFAYVGNGYWNGTVKTGEYQSINCAINSECERIEFTGSIVRPDASYNKRQNFWNSVTLQIDWLPDGHTSSACSWSETMRGHRRVGNHMKQEASEVIMVHSGKEARPSNGKRARRADTMSVKTSESN